MEVDRIICGDCLDVMKDMPDNSVDLVLTDPPYGIGLEYDTYNDSRENLTALAGPFVLEATRISRVVAFTPGNGNQHIYPPPSWTMAWFYKGGANYCSWGFNCWQPILCYGKDPYLANGLGCRADAFVLEETPKDKMHPCPKPMGVMDYLVNRFSVRPNDLILDPFCGSGTTCVAAKMLGRRYIGIDISEKYCEIARKRIAAAEKGITVNELEKGQKVLF